MARPISKYSLWYRTFATLGEIPTIVRTNLGPRLGREAARAAVPGPAAQLHRDCRPLSLLLPFEWSPPHRFDVLERPSEGLLHR